MRFLKKKDKPVILDAFTTDPLEAHIHPITKALGHRPPWLKELRRLDNISPSRSMSSCPAPVNIYRQGFIVPFPFDISINLEDGECSSGHTERMRLEGVAGERKTFDQASSRAHFGWAGNKFHNVKIQFCWRMRSSEPIQYALIEPPYHNEYSDLIFSPTGITDFSYNRAINCHLMLDRSKSEFLSIPAGYPAWYVLPITERPVELRVHFVTQSEIEIEAPVYGSFGKFKSAYYAVVKKLKRKAQ